MDAAALLKEKRSEVLKQLVEHLRERDDYVALELLRELLEISNIQFTLVTDAVADFLNRGNYATK